MALPPDGASVAISRNMLDALVAQPSLTRNRLGPLIGAVNRTLGWAMRERILLRGTALLTVTRTLELGNLRRAQVLGSRTDGRLDLAAVVGAIPNNGGAAILHATHPQLQGVDMRNADLVAYHQERSGRDLRPLQMRLEYLHAVWVELLETLGVSIPIVQRAERRFNEPDEGSLTSDQLWCAMEQPHWAREVDAIFPSEAVVMGECSVEGLRGFTYRTRFGERRLANPEKFLRDVELRLPSLLPDQLTMSDPEAEKGIEGADDLVRLEGHLIGCDGVAYKPVIVLPHPHTDCVVYLIPAARGTGMDPIDWDAVRAALAPIHGAACARSSDDQGLGVTMPRENALSISSVDLDKSSNYDAFRCFSHALNQRSHWRPPDTDPDESRGGEDAEAA
jgi:hypothetical protein